MDIERLTGEDIRDLIAVMVRKAYRTKDSPNSASLAVRACLDLFAKDYKFSVADNENGELCNSYPSKIAVLESELSVPSSNGSVGGVTAAAAPLHDATRLRELVTKARFARCWTRFVIPVILYEGRHICRSATISSGTEIYGRSSFDLFFTGGESVPSEDSEKIHPSVITRQLCDRVRTQDIKLLDEFGVHSVCDLMVEARKVKYMVSITSSEKVDKQQRYSRFSLWSMPYPGCEFFRQWHDRDYAGEESFFNWEQAYVNSHLELPYREKWFEDLDVPWEKYKRWNIVRLTQNYMKILLKFVQDGDKGLLIHCISGWDRTPLFISLLRLSLWADGLVHKSLSAWQILFLTMAYDWYLFGHNLPDRLAKGEEILFFCFYFLKYMQDDGFVVTRRRGCRTMSVNSLSASDGHDVTCSSWSSLRGSTPVESASCEWQDDGLRVLEEELLHSNGRTESQHRSEHFYFEASVSDSNLCGADDEAGGPTSCRCRSASWPTIESQAWQFGSRDCRSRDHLGTAVVSATLVRSESCIALSFSWLNSPETGLQVHCCSSREFGVMTSSDARWATRGHTAARGSDDGHRWQIASCGDLQLGFAAAAAADGDTGTAVAAECDRCNRTPTAVQSPPMGSQAGHVHRSALSASDLETVGSWQMLDSFDFRRESSSLHLPTCRSSSSGSHVSQGSSKCPSRPAHSAHGVRHAEPTERRTRLEQVRTHFYDAYRTVVGIGAPPPGSQAAAEAAAAAAATATGQAGSRRADTAQNEARSSGGRISSLLDYLAAKVSSRK